MKKQRIYTLVIGGYTIQSNGLSPLQIQFKTHSTITSQQDEFTIDVYNLSPMSRSILNQEYAPVEVYAGYENTGAGLIAKGELRRAYTSREGVDVITTIIAGSGDKGVEKGKVNKTHSKGATVQDVLNECAKGMESVSVGQIKGCEVKADKTHMTTVGSPKRVMDKLAKRANFDWFIEYQELKALKKDDVFDGFTMANTMSGDVVGSPRQTEKGVTVDLLLSPEVRLGTTLQVISKDINRTYKIVGYSHEGDFYGTGASWKTTITAEELGKTDNGSCS